MENTLYAGFARVDITPKEGGIPLAGYGATHRRLAAQILDRLYANFTALRQNGETCVMLTLDIIRLREPQIEQLRKAISERTGLPFDRIFLGVTHTHSAPDTDSSLPPIINWRYKFLPPVLAEGAARAIADLKPARLFYGAGNAGHERARLNFNRYYKMVPIEKKDRWTEEDVIMVGDNFGNQYAADLEHYAYVGHEEKADPSLQILRFERDDADDIVLVNFAAHATVTGAINAVNLSSDYPGAFVRRMEEIFPGIKCTFLQGCAGNVNPYTRMPEEGIRGLTCGNKAINSHTAYAAALAGEAYAVMMRGMKPSETDTLAFRQRIHTADINHSMDHLLPLTTQILELYQKEGYSQAVRQMCLENGFNSIYHCSNVVARSKEPLTGKIELNAIRIGDCAMVTAPFELFSATGLHIKAASPFALTVVKAYSCGFQSYLPSRNSTPDSYESNSTRYVRGTAEELETHFAEMLSELRG